FESKSQHKHQTDKDFTGVSDYVKDTILKANHNYVGIGAHGLPGVSDYIKDTIFFNQYFLNINT
ncbi:MAG: hypothetical protein PHS58_08880, partial [Bacteroidales bacterium]|nr:hypothetical protein [Bacteroidales bacterium]